MNPRIRRRTGLAAALVGPLGLAACGRHTVDPPKSVTQAEIDKAMQTPTEHSESVSGFPSRAR